MSELDNPLFIIFLAGLATAIGQSFVLFINKVKPFRFILSLFFGSLVFSFSFFILAISTFFVLQVVFGISVDFTNLMIFLALGYKPLSLSFLNAIPYFGIPISYMLNLWTYFLMVYFLSQFEQLSFLQSGISIIFGWLLMQLINRSFGQPFSRLNRFLYSFISNTNFEPSLKKLNLKINFDLDSPKNSSEPKNDQRFFSNLQTLVGVSLVILIIFFLLASFRSLYFQTSDSNNFLFDILFQFFWFFVTFIFASLVLAPVEGLAWWAGWWKGSPDINLNFKFKVDKSKGLKIEKFIVYLDGIGQVSSYYLPETEQMLKTLELKLPDQYLLIKGVVPYSINNKSLSKNRPLAFLWRWAEKYKFKNQKNLIGKIINLRNFFIVAVSTDYRYSKIYNQAIASTIIKRLLDANYKIGSGISIVLFGQSGGAQFAAGTLSYIKDYFKAPVSLVFLLGITSGNVPINLADNIYDIKSESDFLNKISTYFFPRKWKIAFLSSWNKVYLSSKYNEISLGKVKHTSPEGILDKTKKDKNNLTNFEKTVSLLEQVFIKI
jgi:hypothetical protein